MFDDDASSIVFVLLGGLAGAALAILFAPRSDTRRRLRRLSGGACGAAPLARRAGRPRPPAARAPCTAPGTAPRSRGAPEPGLPSSGPGLT